VLKRALILLSLPALFLLASVRNVACQASYSIDLMGFSWPRRDIPVYVSGNVEQAHRDAVLLAVRIWTSAQGWFSETYMAGEGYPFFLYLSDKPVEGAITISFVVDVSKVLAGDTQVSISNRIPSKVSIYVNLPDVSVQAGDPYVQSVLLHELGHALGLGHTRVEGDLMYGATKGRPSTIPLPSTLDLHALFLLGQGKLEAPSMFFYASPSWIAQGTLRVPAYYQESRYKFAYSYSRPAIVGSNLRLGIRIDNIGKKTVKVINTTVVCDWNPESPILSTNATDLVQPSSDLSFAWQVPVPDSVGIGNHTLLFRTWIATLQADGWSLLMPKLSEQTVTVPVVKATRISTTESRVTTSKPSTLALPLLDIEKLQQIGGVAATGGSIAFGWFFKTRKRRFTSAYLRRMNSTHDKYSANPQECKRKLLQMRDEILQMLENGKIDEPQFSILDARLAQHLKDIA